MSAVIVGLFPRAADAEIALNNLDEAGYDPATVSVLTEDPARARALSNAHGALSQVAAGQLPAALVSLGLPAGDSGVYGERLAAGAVFVAVEAPDGSEEDAKEILSSEKAELVRSLPGKARS